MKKLYRRLRVLEYIGTQQFVDGSLENRAVKGTFAQPNGVIIEAMLGDAAHSEVGTLENDTYQAAMEQLAELQRENRELRILTGRKGA